MAMTLAFGLFELFALVVALPKFEDIFNGPLEGKPLPPITTILLDFRYAFVVLAIFWMLTAVRTFQHRASSCLSYVLLTAASAQSAYTVIALFLPFIVTPFIVTIRAIT